MNFEPLVSVYVTTKNRPKLLVRALTSVYLQTYKNIEVLVCDDGSEMDLSAIQRAFSILFDKLIWIRNDSSKGAGFSRNKLIALSSGDFVTGLDDDDEFTPDRIEAFITHSQLHKYAFLCSRYLKRHQKLWVLDKKSEGIIDMESIFESNVVGNQIFIRKDHLITVGGFDEDAPSMMDHDLWLRLMQRYGCGYRINNSTYKLYQDRSVSRITNSNDTMHGVIYFINKHKKEMSTKMIQNLKISDAVNRQRRLSISEFLSAIQFGSLFFILVYLVSRVRLFNRNFDS